MNRARLLVYVLLSLSAGVHGDPGKARVPVDSEGVAFDCGANSIYIMAGLAGRPVSFAHALQLTPPNPAGNSLVEMRIALKTLGFEARAVKLTLVEILKLKVPAILLALPPASKEGADIPRSIGHYFIVLPLGEDEVQILNYPRPPLVVSRQDLKETLAANSQVKYPAILCGTGAEIGEEMSVPMVAEAPVTTAGPATGPMGPAAEETVRLVDGARRSPVASHDFGDIAEGQIISHVFKVINGTNRPVRVARTANSCSCTELSVEPKEIPAGAVGELTMSMSTSQRYGSQVTDGAVYFDDESKIPPVLLRMSGYVHARFVPVPAVVDLGRYDTEKGAVSHVVAIRPTTYAGTSRIARLVSDSDSIKATLREDETGGQSAELRFSPGRMTGLFADRIQMFADNQTTAAATIEVRALLLADVAVKPERILLVGSETPGRLQVEHRARRKLNQVTVTAELKTAHGEAGSSGVTATSMETATGVSEVVIRVAKEVQAKHLHGTLLVSVSAEGAGEPYLFRVPFIYSPE